MEIKFKDCVKIGAGLWVGRVLAKSAIYLTCGLIPELMVVIFAEDNTTKEYNTALDEVKNVPRLYNYLVKKGYITVKQETRRKIGF